MSVIAASSTIAQRVAAGEATQSTANGAIVPAAFSNARLPSALTGIQAADVQNLLSSGYRARRHIYHAPDGREIMQVVRFERGDGKTFRPMHYAGAGAAFALTAIPGLRPLYNLHHLANRPDAMVLIVEGEKAADAAGELFPDMVCVTWPGGAASVGKADWRDLAGRTVVLWSDNDKAGRDAEPKVAGILAGLGCRVSIVPVPEGFPAGWDLADPIPPGAPDAATLLAAAAPYVPSPPCPKGGKASAGDPAARRNDSERLHRFFSAVRFLGTTGMRNYAPGGGYSDWIALMCASKHGFTGDTAFGEFCQLSWDYGGTDSEDQLRRRWDSIEDRPDGEKITPGTFFAQATAAGWEDPGAAGGGSGGDPGGGRADAASEVLDQSAIAGDMLWIDQNGKPHVSLIAEDADGVERTVHVRVGGKRHKGIVGKRFRAAHPKRLLSAEQEKRAMQMLEHEARECGVVLESANRVARDGDSLYIDLGRVDGKAVRVRGDGWDVVGSVPVRFVRGSRGELPLPVGGGSMDMFRRHFNLSDADVTRVVAFILGALSPIPSFPILLIEGGQGTGKSLLGDLVLALCDPPISAKVGRITMPRGEQNLLVHAAGVRVVFCDNMSDISEAESDALCRLATGGGSTARQHYSDEDEVQISATRPTVITAIGTPTGRGDLLDRCLRVTARPIAHRRTEEDVRAGFDADRASMLGLLLDGLSASLRNKADVSARVAAWTVRLPRMADFGLVVESAAPALGMEVGAFSCELADEQANMQAEGALGDPLGEALVRYFSAGRGERKELSGPATEFLDALRLLTADLTGLPASNKLRGALRRIQPGLSDLGILIEMKAPEMGIRNRKAHYTAKVTDAFVRVGEDLPF